MRRRGVGPLLGPAAFVAAMLLGGGSQPAPLGHADGSDAPYGGWDEGAQPGVRVGVRWVRGDSDNGFRIRWSDGTTTFTPTRSEELAECTEYALPRREAACIATVRTEHRWLTELRRSLRMHNANH